MLLAAILFLVFGLAASGLAHPGEQYGEEHSSTSINWAPPFNPTDAINFASTGMDFHLSSAASEKSSSTPCTTSSHFTSSFASIVTPAPVSSTRSGLLTITTIPSSPVPATATSSLPSTAQSVEEVSSTGAAQLNNPRKAIAIAGGLLAAMVLL